MRAISALFAAVVPIQLGGLIPWSGTIIMISNASAGGRVAMAAEGRAAMAGEIEQDMAVISNGVMGRLTGNVKTVSTELGFGYFPWRVWSFPVRRPLNPIDLILGSFTLFRPVAASHASTRCARPGQRGTVPRTVCLPPNESLAGCAVAEDAATELQNSASLTPDLHRGQ